MLIDVILEGKCNCCKEIYYQASLKDPSIGPATVYRMVNTLEQIGAISRKNMYRISDDGNKMECMVELEDGTVLDLPEDKWTAVIKTGLDACGFSGGQNETSHSKKHNIVKKRSETERFGYGGRYRGCICLFKIPGNEFLLYKYGYR